MRTGTYQAPGSARYLLHFVVVALIGAAVLGTTMLSSVVPGDASNDAALTSTSTGQNEPETISASHSQSSTRLQALDANLEALIQPQATTQLDSLLLAVLSLEASTSNTEVEESKERVMNLVLPEGIPPLGPLTENKEEPEADTNTDEAEEKDEAEEDSLCAETSNAAYCIYTVAAGDTLNAIAGQLGFTGNASLSAAEMLAQSNRPDIMSSDHIETGQNLRIPRERGIVHTVLSAQNASQIAAGYGIDVEVLLASPYNSFGADGVVGFGQEVFVPDPTQLPTNQEVELTLEDEESEEAPADESLEEPTAEPTSTETPTEEPTPEPTSTETPTEEPTAEPTATNVPYIPQLGALDTPTPRPTATPTPTATPEPTSTRAAEPTATSTPASTRSSGGGGGSTSFIWPAEGPISSYYGPSHPLGIDIDLYNNESAPIVASRSGEVVFAGGDPCCSYGYYVIIDHGNGVQTLYAHFARLAVSQGEFVSQGQFLGTGGRTGNATGNHLHFEIRVDGNVVDPLRYLP